MNANLRLARAEPDALLNAAIRDGLNRLGLPAAGASALEVADLPLPNLDEAPRDRALLRALGPLYLAAECEEAGVLPAAEQIAALWASGAIPIGDGRAADALHTFFRERNERFAESERSALFAHVFGSTSGPTLAAAANTEFALRMLDLTECLVEAGDPTTLAHSPALATDLVLKARALAENLSRHGSGFALYAASNVLNATRAGAALLGELARQRLWGSRDVWTLLRIFHNRLQVNRDVESHVRRGHAGMVIIGWLAEPVATIANIATSTTPQVMSAAAAWIHASLAIESAGRRSRAGAA